MKAMSSVPSETAEERVPLAEQAYRALKRRILDNDLAPGAVLLEQELAALLGMSRTPVREAMVRLAEEGMVAIRPRHGMRVLPISAEDMRDIYDVLAALESEAAGLVAARTLSSDEARSLREAVAAMDAALARDDLPAWAEADERFHRCLVDACPNARLRGLIYQFWDQAHRVRMATLRLRPKPVSSNADHLALVEAIESGFSERAREVHRRHRVRNGEMLVRLLREHGLRTL
jgi:DNA-binding GntR family transcriptional regulator